MKKTLFLLAVATLVACRPPGPDLLPGEVREPGFLTPIIAAASDSVCSDSTGCPSKIGNCVLKDFTVQKDTLYHLTVVYYNGDTTTASCRTCATVFKGDSVVMNRFTGCPTGGPWMDHAKLLPGVTYTLAVCLQRCPDLQHCNCGKKYLSQAIVSMRWDVPCRWPPW